MWRAITCACNENSLDSAFLSAEEIDQHKLREVRGVGEVCFAIRHRGHLFHELDEVVIAREHERINHDAGFATGLDFTKRCVHDPGIAAHGILVELSRGERMHPCLPAFFKRYSLFKVQSAQVLVTAQIGVKHRKQAGMPALL